MTRHNRRGFTLIELLVVISVIAILAAILLPAVNSTLRNANISRARIEMQSIINAVSQFKNEYGRYPDHNGTGGNDLTYGLYSAGFNEFERNYELQYALRAIDASDNSSHALNPKRIVFLDVHQSNLRMPKDFPDPYDFTTDLNFFHVDPWGMPYEVIIDANYNDISENITLKDTQAGAPVQYNDVTNKSVVVISRGPDTYMGVTPFVGNAKDNILSWE